MNMAKNCTRCGQTFVGMFGVQRAEADEVIAVRNSGIEVPDCLCTECFSHYKVKVNATDVLEGKVEKADNQKIQRKSQKNKTSNKSYTGEIIIACSFLFCAYVIYKIAGIKYGMISITAIIVITYLSVYRDNNLKEERRKKWSIVSKSIDKYFEKCSKHEIIASNIKKEWHYAEDGNSFGFFVLGLKSYSVSEYIFKYSDIVYLSIDVDGNRESSTTESSGSIGRAVAGGILFGAPGAIIGANIKRTGKIDTQKFHNALIYIGLIFSH